MWLCMKEIVSSTIKNSLYNHLYCIKKYVHSESSTNHSCHCVIQQRFSVAPLWSPKPTTKVPDVCWATKSDVFAVVAYNSSALTKAGISLYKGFTSAIIKGLSRCRCCATTHNYTNGHTFKSCINILTGKFPWIQCRVTELLKWICYLHFFNFFGDSNLSGSDQTTNLPVLHHFVGLIQQHLLIILQFIVYYCYYCEFFLVFCFVFGVRTRVYLSNIHHLFSD